jgi:hypothetical protein
MQLILGLLAPEVVATIGTLTEAEPTETTIF